MNRVLAALALGATLAAVLALVVIPSERATATPAPAPAAPCDWHVEYERTLAELGEDPDAWFVVGGNAMGDAGGSTFMDSQRVIVDRDQPCRIVASIVRHEHMHLQQARLYGGKAARDWYGDRLEIVADCGSWLLGSTYTPYRDKAGGCSGRDLADARALIDTTPAAAVTR